MNWVHKQTNITEVDSFCQHKPAQLAQLEDIWSTGLFPSIPIYQSPLNPAKKKKQCFSQLISYDC